jgi:hypothetical protein
LSSKLQVADGVPDLAVNKPVLSAQLALPLLQLLTLAPHWLVKAVRRRE